MISLLFARARVASQTSSKMGLGSSKSTNEQMQEMVFGLKLQSKEMQRQAGKADKEMKKEKLKIKKVPHNASTLHPLAPTTLFGANAYEVVLTRLFHFRAAAAGHGAR